MSGKVEKNKYLWEKKTGTELQFWPKTSSEHYLTRPTLPKHLAKKNTRARISSPPELKFDVLETRGIFNAAITEHNGNYYQSRADEEFAIVLYTVEGSAEVRFGGRTRRINKNAVFVCPAGASYEFRATSHWKNIWFHIGGVEWRNIFGEVPLILKAKFSKKIRSVAFEYFAEVYKPDRALRLLGIYADLMSYYIREEFVSASDKTLSLVDSAFSEMRANIRKPSEEISKLPIVSEAADSIKKTYGISAHAACVKMKMREARALLLSGGTTLSEIAEAVGYANAYSFSKAFKIMHGMSPSAYSQMGH